MLRVRLTLVVLAVAAAVPGGGAAAGPAYLAPVRTAGMVFPVARTDWYSLVTFANDWHAPRMRLIGGRWRQVGVHEGTDIFAEPRTPIRSVTDGTVEQAGWLFYSGWRVGVRDDRGRYWFYAHMRSFAPGIARGARVGAGDVIGAVGNTGYGDVGHQDEFTYHLHIGIQRASGVWVNPYPIMRRLYRAAVTASR